MQASRRLPRSAALAGCLLLLCVLLSPPVFALEARPASVLIFLSKDCPRCDAVREQNLAQPARKLGCTVRPECRAVEEPKDYELLVCLEQEFHDEGNEFPVVFVSSHVLGGTDEIAAHLEELARKYVREGGMARHTRTGDTRHIRRTGVEKEPASGAHRGRERRDGSA